jgi:hypothetical protein
LSKYYNNQVRFRTNNLIKIIQLSKIHSHLLGSYELFDQFKYFKVSLFIGTDMPLEINVENTDKLLLSKITIYY